MKKKLVAGLLTMCMAASALAGCGGSGDAETSGGG